jgi:putative hydrolase of the HAD superfamily
MRNVVSFDLDGTLIRGSGAAALRETSLALADGDEAGGDEVFSQLMEDHEALLRSGDALAAYDWECLIRRRAARLGRAVPLDLVVRMRELAEAGHARAINGATREGLEQLREDGWRVVALTNGWLRFQESMLAATGLRDAFDEVITSDRVGRAKPAPDMFLAARGHARCHVHVGDRYDHDIAGGNAAGATTVLLRADIPAFGPLSGPGAVDPSVAGPYLRALAVAESMSSAPGDPVEFPAFFARSLTDVAGFLRTLRTFGHR